MQASAHLISIAKTARYFTWGKDITKARYIWFACHGYGQLAEYFIKNFQGLDPEAHYVVAPEGIHRFYLNGFSGRVGATWMTKEARLYDISDYVAFLDQVCEASGIRDLGDNQELIAFGFSQGVATISRWIAMGKHKPSKAMFWAGAFPPDLEPVKGKAAFHGLPVISCVGASDPFVTEGHFERETSHFREIGITPKVHRYEGAHNIPKNALMDAFEHLKAL